MAQAEHVTTAIPTPITGANSKPHNLSLHARHVDLVGALIGHPPRRIRVDVTASDLAERADHLDKVLKAVSVYVAAVLEEAGENVPGGLDLRDVEAIFSDLVSEVTGIVRRAAEDMAGRFA